MPRIEHETSPIDRHVGRRMMERRLELRLSQQAMATSIGVSFQQVQKYERGANRVSASRLWQAAQVLRVDVNYFYEDMPLERPDLPLQAPTPAPATRHTAAIAQLAPKLPLSSQRLIEGLMREMAPADD